MTGGRKAPGKGMLPDRTGASHERRKQDERHRLERPVPESLESRAGLAAF